MLMPKPHSLITPQSADDDDDDDDDDNDGDFNLTSDSSLALRPCYADSLSRSNH